MRSVAGGDGGGTRSKKEPSVRDDIGNKARGPSLQALAARPPRPPATHTFGRPAAPRRLLAPRWVCRLSHRRP